MKSLTELFNFTGKTAVVTGGAMGIGYGIVQRLHEAGANVVIADIDETVGTQKAAALDTAAAPCTFIKTDVSAEADVKQLVATTMQRFGSLDVFVNNAGIFPQKPVLDMEVALWDKIQAVNGRGVFLCCREAGKIMKQQGKGNIINIASIDALHPSMAGLAAYDASKHGVWGFTKNLALEAGKYGIRVNAVAPGGINTEGVQKMSSGAVPAGVDMAAVMKQFMAKIPMGRMGEPDDIATAVLFLASDAASYMTGEIIVVDGGVLLS
ncbi:MAG: SDR family NAD(P)-dependent oxidoreductase [Patescibacteria group bacterium]|jgi:2-deoxy-D-gluconate 3-dehydrogenase